MNRRTSAKPSANDQKRHPPDVRPVQTETGYEREGRFDTRTDAVPDPNATQSSRSGWRDTDQDFTNYGDGAYDYQSPGDAHRMTSAAAPYRPGDSLTSEQNRSALSGGANAYARSDERIREEICDRIARLGIADSTRVEVSVEAGEVTLTGTISERQAKHAIEDSVGDIPGVTDVHNQLRVARQAQSPP